MRHIISVLVENEFGVLAKVSGLFSGRGFNIESLCVAETTDPTVSRITLVTSGDDRVLEQVTKHLNKQVNVIRVSDFSNASHVKRELVLVKVSADERTRGEVLSVVNIFRGITRTDDVANGIVTAKKANPLKVPLVIRLTGTNEEIAVKILQENGLSAMTDMDEAVKKAVSLATGKVAA